MGMVVEHEVRTGADKLIMVNMTTTMIPRNPGAEHHWVPG
jgi:hypothetical protein